MSQRPILSVIIPTLNEVKYGYLDRILSGLKELSQTEVICVDGGSRDGTLEIIKNHGAKLILTDSNARARRLNQGFANSLGEVVLFHHPRSLIDTKGIRFLSENKAQVSWGGFLHSFDVFHPLLKFTSWYSNNVRPKYSQILYLDHCIFAQRSLVEKLGPEPFSNVDIFEDTVFSRKLAQFCKPQILPFTSKTSAVRFVSNGVFRQALLNQIMKLGFHLELDTRFLNKIYEKGLGLNSSYRK